MFTRNGEGEEVRNEFISFSSKQSPVDEMFKSNYYGKYNRERPLENCTSFTIKTSEKAMK
jgi:hypothetical protein